MVLKKIIPIKKGGSNEPPFLSQFQTKPDHQVISFYPSDILFDIDLYLFGFLFFGFGNFNL